MNQWSSPPAAGRDPAAADDRAPTTELPPATGVIVEDLDGLALAFQAGRNRADGPKRTAVTSDSTAAWWLADAAAPCLTGDDRVTVFVELGCGQHHRAVEQILSAVVDADYPLPVAVLAMLAAWLDLYAGSPEERRLRRLLVAIAPQR